MGEAKNIYFTCLNFETLCDAKGEIQNGWRAFLEDYDGVSLPRPTGSNSWSRSSVTRSYGLPGAENEMYPFPVKRYFRF